MSSIAHRRSARACVWALLAVVCLLHQGCGITRAVWEPDYPGGRKTEHAVQVGAVAHVGPKWTATVSAIPGRTDRPAELAWTIDPDDWFGRALAFPRWAEGRDAYRLEFAAQRPGEPLTCVLIWTKSGTVALASLLIDVDAIDERIKPYGYSFPRGVVTGALTAMEPQGTAVEFAGWRREAPDADPEARELPPDAVAVFSLVRDGVTRHVGIRAGDLTNDVEWRLGEATGELTWNSVGRFQATVTPVADGVTAAAPPFAEASAQTSDGHEYDTLPTVGRVVITPVAAAGDVACFGLAVVTAPLWIPVIIVMFACGGGC